MKILLPSQSCAVFEWVLCSPPIKTPLSCSSTAGATDRKQSTMLLKILCYIYYVHLHTIYSVNDYKSLDFLSKLLLLSYLTQWCFLWMEILFCFSRHRSLMCYVLYKCTVRIGCTRSSSLFKEVKLHWARLVHGWMTIPGIFFALIPQYHWPVGISVSSTYVCPSKL